jgi:hypothetical protein
MMLPARRIGQWILTAGLGTCLYWFNGLVREIESAGRLAVSRPGAG